MTDDPRRLRNLAIVGFLFHYPGVRVLGGRRLRPEWTTKNVVALGATFAAMAVIGLVAARSGHAGAGVFGAWCVGHFVWSGWLAWGIATGRALRPEDG